MEKIQWNSINKNQNGLEQLKNEKIISPKTPVFKWARGMSSEVKDLIKENISDLLKNSLSNILLFYISTLNIVTKQCH